MDARPVPKADPYAKVAVIAVACIFFALAALTSALPPTHPLSLPETIPEDLDTLDTGDTAWTLISAALVLLMTPGVGFFYGGMVTHKNVISTIYQTFVGMGIISILWTIIGFSLAFGADADGGIMGYPRSYYMYNGVGALPHPTLCPTIPLSVFSMFQLMFAIITPILISGAMAERVNFNSWMIFICLWHILVYCPLVHIIWHPQGILRKWDVIDFAGGIPVEMASGFSSLAAAIFVGPRLHDPSPRTANLPFVLLGTAILWFGWFGFNAGSAIGSGPLAGQAFVTTNICAASAMMTWVFLDLLLRGCSSAVGACNGAVVGMVAITPAAGYVTCGSGMVIGVIACLVAYGVGIVMKERSGVDDSLDVFTIHGISGLVGFLCTGIFCSKDVNPAIKEDGLIYGKGLTLAKHIAVVLVLIPCIMIATYALCFISNLIVPLRVTKEEEELGLDISMHNESALGSAAPEHVSAKLDKLDAPVKADETMA
jgi:Amt family ammonium transporter